MRFEIRHLVLILFAGLALSLGTVRAAAAGGDGCHSGQPLLPQYQQECASCHIAYPPGMLPSASWQRLMNNLRQHYGTDASLDAPTSKEIADWLAANSGTYKRVREQPPEDRITKSAWFTRKHREVSAAGWQRPAVKSPANCSACHRQADKGDFNERNIRIPR